MKSLFSSILTLFLTIASITAQTDLIKDSILDTGRFHINTSRSTSLNVNFFVNLVDVAAKVASIVVTNNNNSGGSQRPFSTQQINALATSIQGLIRTPISVTHDTENKDEVQRLINGRRIFTFEANNPVDITMYSFPSVGAGGFTSWKSNGRVFSRYYMSTVMNGAAPRQGLEACCSRPIAMWVTGFMPNFASFRTSVQSHIRSVWPQRGRPEVRSDFGTILGSLPIGCIEDAEEEDPKIRPGSTILSDNSWLEQKTDGLYFKDANLNSNYQYIVYDINGRVLKQGTGTEAQEKIFDYKDSLNGSGFYIVHIYMNGINKVFKMFKNN